MISNILAVTFRLTLQILPSDSRTLRAARSRWTNPLLARYCIPNAVWCEKLRRILGVSGHVILSLLHREKEEINKCNTEGESDNCKFYS